MSKPAVDHAAASRQMEGGVFDERARTLLESADKFTRSAFNLPNLSFRRATTYTAAEGDCMLAEWSFDGSPFRGAVILRDTPLWSTYQFRFPDGEFRTQKGVEETLERLVHWGFDPLRLAGINMALVMRGAEVLDFVSPRTSPIATIMVADLEFIGTNTESGSYLAVRIGKWYTARVYPVMPFVPERFPPLDELAKGWSTERIMTELDSRVLPEVLSDNRNRILAGELVRREIDEGELLRMLQPKDGSRYLYEHRAQVVFGQLEQGGKAAFLDAEAPQILELYRRVGDAGLAAAARLFLREANRCGEAPEQLAVSTFRSGSMQSAALGYLRRCSSTEEVAKIIEQSAGNGVRTVDVRWAVDFIRERASKAANHGK